jgi:hypothetical protein
MVGLRQLFLVVIFVFVSNQVLASHPQPQRVGNIPLQEMVDKLRKLVREGRRGNAADRRFLNKLRHLAREYAQPWRWLLLSDDFSDGDFVHKPRWIVLAGQFVVEPRHGLRSVARHRAPPRPHKRSFRDKLRDAIRNKLGRKRDEPPPLPEVADIHIPVPVTTSFSVRLRLVAHDSRGRFQFLLYRGRQRQAGYRLTWIPGKAMLRLHYFSGTRVSRIEKARLADGTKARGPHRISWSRDRKGYMSVSFDGKQLFKVREREREGFSGIEMVNRGGDFSVRRVQVLGTGRSR